MTRQTLTLGAAVALLGVTGSPAPDVLTTRTAAGMVEAARHLLSLLDATQRDKVLYAFADEERFDWHFVPRERRGLPLEDMNPQQRAAAHRLLQSATSAAGYLKATGIIQLEWILGQLEGRPDRRNPERYHVWVFGAPSADSAWGWRFEGHHLSINFTSVTGEVVAATPTFMGSNPALVPTGPFAGTRVLGSEEDMGRALLASLSEGQRRRAIVADTAPRDIITGADRQAVMARFEGLPASAMTAAQRDQLRALLRVYVGNMEAGIAARYLARIDEAGFDRLHFAWAGSLVAGEGHYYRVHGPTVLIEYDNTQNDANHVHSVWRDLTDDFGGDLLRRHYEEADHH